MKTLPFLCLILLTNSVRADGIKAGFADREVTPDIGMEVPGGYGKAFGKTVNDAPKVRAAVIDDGRRRVAIVGLDALIIRRETVLEVRRRIAERTGIAPECVLLGASHSHTSGPVGMVLPGEFDHASKYVQELAYEKSSCADAKYLERFIAGIVDAVAAADSGKVDALLSFGSGKAEGVAFNRRQRMKNGLSASHAGRGNPDILGYAGPVDPEVATIGAWTKDGKPLGVVVNFSCHATTGPAAFSANWFYFLEKTVRGGLGGTQASVPANDAPPQAGSPPAAQAGSLCSSVPVVFLQGCCGDITQVDNLDPYAAKTGDFYGQLIGGTVGAEVLKVLFRAERGAGPFPVEAKVKTWTVKRRIPDPERVARCLADTQKNPKEVGATEWTFAKEIVLLDALIAKQRDVEVEVQAIQVGPAVFLTNEAEFFVEYGLDLKKRSNFKMTIPVELANGCVGYVPTAEALGPHGGGYETRLTSYSNLEVSAGQQFVDAALELAKQFTPSPFPEALKAKPAPTGWQYGSVPPELK